MAALQAAPASSAGRPTLWLSLSRAWSAAAAERSATATAAAPPPDECHERAYAACAAGLRELRPPSDLPAVAAVAPLCPAGDALSRGRVDALAALAALPARAPLPLGHPSCSRIYVLSDLHVDQPLPWRCDCRLGPGDRTPPLRLGMDWVRALGSDAEGCLVVAGDVADSLAATLTALAELRRRFARVFYVPGNHDLFLRGADARAFPDSWCKLFALRRACAQLRVETAPAAVATTPAATAASSASDPAASSPLAPVVVAPLLSWYDDGDFCGGGGGQDGGSPSTRLRYDAPCDWGAVRDADVHRVMLSLGKRDLATAARAAGEGGAAFLLTATHFLPRRELPYWPALRAAMGNAALGALVLPALRAAAVRPGGGAHVHCYGHSHRNGERGDLGDEVLYVQHALGGGPEEEEGVGQRGGLRRRQDGDVRGACRCFAPRVVWRQVQDDGGGGGGSAPRR